MSKATNNAARRIDFTKSDEELLVGMDKLLRDATGGDRRAIGCIAIALGPMLNDEAKDALGKTWDQDSGDVLQELFLAMCEERLVFPAIRGAAIPWMKRTVREIAQKWMKSREDDAGPDLAG